MPQDPTSRIPTSAESSTGISRHINMKPFTLNIRGKILRIDHPLVMGILNVTPDSFYDQSRTLTPEDGRPVDVTSAEAAARIAEKAKEMISQGADIIDVGGYSTRPGALPVSLEDELRRVEAGVRGVREISPDVLISVDTFRSEVARRAVEQWGADIINDISAGEEDAEMIPTVARLKVPYIMMHKRGTPETMAAMTDYPDGIVAGVVSELRPRIVKATLAGISDIIIDPGFGFAKSVEQNYRLMRGIPLLEKLLDDRPVLVGISRKSMIYKPLNIPVADTLPATHALNTIALSNGAAILRVHDVAPARQVVDVVKLLPDD